METLCRDAIVSYNAVEDSVTYENISYDYRGSETSTLDWNYYTTSPEIVYYYPYYSYPYYSYPEDTYKKAFNIAKLLLKKNLLASRKLKDFIGLVEEIAKEL